MRETVFTNNVASLTDRAGQAVLACGYVTDVPSTGAAAGFTCNSNVHTRLIGLRWVGMERREGLGDHQSRSLILNAALPGGSAAPPDVQGTPVRGASREGSDQGAVAAFVGEPLDRPSFFNSPKIRFI
jgi:hypothetical protein